MIKIRNHLATLKTGDLIKAPILRAGKIVGLIGVVP